MRIETKAHYLEAINRAVEYIESNTSRDISLEELADYSLISKFHFHRVFKSKIGNTAKEYLTRLRLEKSAILLKNSSKAVNRIAYECGYASPETFTRAFNNYFSTSPTKYRQNIKQELANKKVAYQDISLKDLNLASPKIIYKKDFNLAYIRHFGSYDKVGNSFQRLMFWATKNLVLKLMPTTIGIVHDNPEITTENNIRFDACVLVTKEIQPKGEIGYKKITGGKFAIFRYKGAYETFYPVYDYIYNVCLFKHQWELRDEPALEWYIKSPTLHKPEELVTDFYLPIR
jgi:AraC family transcriptional regulator